MGYDIHEVNVSLSDVYIQFEYQEIFSKNHPNKTNRKKSDCFDKMI